MYVPTASVRASLSELFGGSVSSWNHPINKIIITNQCYWSWICPAFDKGPNLVVVV